MFTLKVLTKTLPGVIYNKSTVLLQKQEKALVFLAQQDPFEQAVNKLVNKHQRANHVLFGMKCWSFHYFMVVVFNAKKFSMCLAFFFIIILYTALSVTR